VPVEHGKAQQGWRRAARRGRSGDAHVFGRADRGAWAANFKPHLLEQAFTAAAPAVQVTCASPNYLQPWQMHPQETHKGSGFIIDGHRIITNFHVIQVTPVAWPAQLPSTACGASRGGV
jgi:hypothetical protein